MNKEEKCLCIILFETIGNFVGKDGHHVDCPKHIPTDEEDKRNKRFLQNMREWRGS